MKSLDAFLNPGRPDNEKFALTERFKDVDGNTMEWEIRALTPKEAQLIAKHCRTVNKKGVESFDMMQYQNELIVASVVFPDLRSSALQQSYGVMGESDLITTMLTMGEYADLRTKVFEISGIEVDINQKVDEAKN